MASADHIFHIRNMHCADCATLIDNTLQLIPGVRNAHATAKTNEIHVELDPRHVSPDTVRAAITELGFQLKAPPSRPDRLATSVEPQISDQAWQMLEPLFRERLILEGIAYKYRHGAPWREVPAKFGPWQTLYARLARWRKEGTWAKGVATIQHSAFADELAWIESADG